MDFYVDNDMTAIFISYNQAYYEDIVNIISKAGERGYTMWHDIMGRGTHDGEPHLGSHAWPTMNDAVLTVVDDSNADKILSALRELDSMTPELGIRAFTWEVKGTL